MNSLVGGMNWLASGAFSLLLTPFQGLSPWVSLTVLSVLSGFLMLWIFGRFSDQERIRLLRQRLRGHLLGVRLYQHNIGTVAHFQGRIVVDTLHYLRTSLFPLLVMTVPLLLILAQLNLYFANRPLAVGEATTVTVQLSGSDSLSEVTLEAPGDGVVVETPGVRDPERNQVTWRVRPTAVGRHSLAVGIGDRVVIKEIVSGYDWAATPAFRSASALDLLLYPGEPPPEEPVELVEIRYPPLVLPLLSNWLIFFLVVSMVTAFAFHRAMGVEI